jgi:hypothetical protein
MAYQKKGFRRNDLGVSQEQLAIAEKNGSGSVHGFKKGT